ncbi:MAG: Zn-binding domain-containing protein, partial [Candidatus Sericytochromatia bacterium]
GLAYVMIHTLAHLLIQAAALSCGYPASAIRERIYVPQPEDAERVYGILLYTATSDAQGTLGGLVSLADRLPQLLQEALDLARLCSNDPICAGHEPTDPNEERFLHGAACHGCVLIGETSCEHLNEHLDRALVVRTVHLDAPVTAFFE